MSDIDLIILSAGDSTRFGPPCKKQWLRIADKPLWLYFADKMKKSGYFNNIIITASASDAVLMKKYSDYDIVKGSSQRQYSLKNALEKSQSRYVMVTDIARACVPMNIIETLISQKDQADTIVPYLRVNDTAVYEDKTIDRDKLKLIQTPQLSKTEILKKALDTDTLYTDDSSAVKAVGGSVLYVEGSTEANKITYQKDLQNLPCLEKPSSDTFVGTGYDIHSFEDNKPMKLCGIEIDSSFGFLAHSDGDVAIHSIIDALLGACGYGDIGEFFPDCDETYKNADSKHLLKEISKIVRSTGFEIVNIDVTILMQKPKLKEYKEAMRKKIAELLECDKKTVNIKATTGEKMGYIGRSEGAAVQSICSLKYYDWSKA